MPFEQLGSGLLSGVWPENVQAQFGPFGLEQASWTLHRDPAREWPDMLPYTPFVLHDDGLLSGTGRLQETPTQRGGTDDRIDVVCEGWLAHLNDDAYRARYVNNDLNSWVNARALQVNPAVWLPTFQVDTGQGAVTIGTATGAALNTLGGIAIDAGPGRTWKKIAILWYGSGSANMDLRVAGGDTVGALTETFTPDPTPIATIATGAVVTFATPRRFAYIYAAATGAVAAGAWVNIVNAIAFSESAFDSGGFSVLKASDVVSRALKFAPLLNQGTGEIAATSFNIPHFDGPYATPREVIEAANAFHAYQVKVQDDPAGGQPRLRFRAVPTVPTILARVGAGIEFSDASRNDGGDIYNRAVVNYTDAAGNEAQADRSTVDALAASARFDTLSAFQAPNPSFDVDVTTNWVTVDGTKVRDTGTFDTTPASMRMVSSVAGAASQSATFVASSALRPGKPYRFQFRARRAAANVAAGTTLSAQLSITDSGGATRTVAMSPTLTTASTTFTSVTGTVTFSQAEIDNIAAGFQVQIVSGGNTVSVDGWYVDSLYIFEALPTIPDRQGFIRTRILTTGARLTSAGANQIADIWLLTHQVSPLRGSLRVTGAALQDLQSGFGIPIGLLGSKVGDCILLTEGDPDTSAQGRVGIIAGVTIDYAANTADIQIDSRADFLDALLARFSVFQAGS